MTRRTLIPVLAGASLAAVAAAEPKSKMGLTSTSFQTSGRPIDTLEFLELSHSLGAGGIQCPLTSADPSYLKKLRARLEELNMYFEVMVEMAKVDDDIEPFQKRIRAAKEAGASLARAVVLEGRRYEKFTNAQAWAEYQGDVRGALGRSRTVCEAEKFLLTLENHKDYNGDEWFSLLMEYRSEYFGFCLDIANNIALLDEPAGFVNRFAPFAAATQVKDVVVSTYDNGIRIGDAVLGKGCLPLKEMVAAIQKARPNIRFTLEMHTRDPIDVACLSEAYWSTFPFRTGQFLAKTLAWVRANQGKGTGVSVKGLSPDAIRKLEEDNVRESLRYARENLGL